MSSQIRDQIVHEVGRRENMNYVMNIDIEDCNSLGDSDIDTDDEWFNEDVE